MTWRSIIPGFYVAEDFLPREVAQSHLLDILRLGEAPERGFHHPPLKPNRFHERPMYPVDRYMGLGLYWNPLDYGYHQLLPSGLAPHAIPAWLGDLGLQVVGECFPHFVGWKADAALVNYYRSGRKMGRHVDKEERDHRAPVVGFNFGSTCRFYYQDESFLLPGNSVYVFGEEARLMPHGVGAPYKKSLSWESVGILTEGERLNITLRKVF
jgi:alkylated DNA repair dioxygenase AlkB